MAAMTMKTPGLDVIDQRWHPDGLIELHQQTLDSDTLWSVVVLRSASPSVRRVGQYPSLRAAYDAFNAYSGPQ